MENIIMHSDHASVYPGNYEKAWSEKELEDALQKTGTKYNPVIYMKQVQDHYIIEMAVPGYNKERFFIHTNGNVLSIAAIQKKLPETSTENSAGKIRHESFMHNIILPVDADPDFVTAEYNNGILQICLSTCKKPVEKGSRDIIVY